MGRRKRTEMRILIILVVSAPEERANAACAFDCAVWKVHGYDHGLVDFRLETDDMRSKRFGVLRILLETISGQSLPYVEI